MEVMEVVVLILLVLFGGTIIRYFIAGAKSVVTGESISEAMGHIVPMEIRLTDRKIDGQSDRLTYKAVEVRGLFPVQRSMKAAFLISIFDKSEGDGLQPVLSVIEQFQEPHSTAFQQRADIGQVEPNQGFKRWVEIGRIISLFLQAPRSGDRQLNVVVRLVDAGSEPNIHLGKHSGASAIWTGAETMDHQQITKGYQDVSEHRDETYVLGVKLALSVAMADGNLDDSEGLTIRGWMEKVITPFSKEKQVKLKKELNDGMKLAYSQAVDGDFSFSPIVERINEIADDAMKFEVMELCYDVMAADGKADAEEMKVLRQLGGALELDFQELEKIRDLKMIDISAEVDVSKSNDELLGIDPNWDGATIRRHLRKEFRKWNSRLNNFTAGSDRDHAQRMLDVIGEARKKYG